LWRLYFGGKVARAGYALERSPQERRPWLALTAFGYVFLPILGGIVVIAAGLKLALVHYNQPATGSTAFLLAGGVALYLAGLVLFRWFLHIGPLLIRLRSEEHTSELQSPCNLVCRLLLEKKKKI